MSKTSSQLLTAFAATALLLAGCSSGTASNSSEPTAPSSGVSLTIWVDPELSETTATIAAQLKQNTGHTLDFVEKDFSNLEAELSAAGADTPDLFIGSSEWTTRLAASGFIAPLGPSGLPGFSEAVTSGTEYQGQLYGVPYAVENLALVCDGERVDRQPASGESLTTIGYRLVLNPGGDPYTLFPLQSSFGVLPLARDEFGDWTEETGFEAQRGEEFALWLAANRNLIRELDYSSGVSALINGAQPCLLTGPWSIPELRERAKFELKVYRFPSFGSEPALVFSSARAVFVTAAGENLEAAIETARYFATEPVQLLIHNQTGRIPAMQAAASATRDPVIIGFAEAAGSSVVLPGNLAMQNSWAPWTRAVNALIRSDEDPVRIWEQLLSEIKTAIG